MIGIKNLIKNIFKKARKTTGAATISWKENKAIRSEIQGGDDPQMIPQTRISIVKDKRSIGIIFRWYIARIFKINFTIKGIWLKIRIKNHARI